MVNENEFTLIGRFNTSINLNLKADTNGIIFEQYNKQHHSNRAFCFDTVDMVDSISEKTDLFF